MARKSKANNTMNLARMAAISKALADPARLRIYERIAASKEVSCGQLIECDGLTPGTISHHLKTLNEAGLIECRREGQFVYNRALPHAMREYSAALMKLARQ